MTTRNKAKRRDHNREFSNQAWGACLRPYNAFLSLQTYPEACEILGGGVI
jgi:hypothetical protein